MFLVKTISFWIALFVYISVLMKICFSYKNVVILDNFMSILYAFAWSTGISGLIMNVFYSNDFTKKYNITQQMLILSDIFLHIIPIILITKYAPVETDISFYEILAGCILIFILIGKYVLKIYIGIPIHVLFLLPMIITISSFYLRYGK